MHLSDQDRAGAAINRQRYVTLDALRGVAAVMVVLFHAGHNIGVWIPKFGYLAVDLFFLLSGFVLARSYGPRFQVGMRPAEFFLARIVRLYPLYFFGLLLGSALALLGFGLPGLTVKHIAVSFLFGLLGLPSYVLPHGQVLFSLNMPFWSLFFEFWVANIVFGLFWKALDQKVLLCLIIVCAAGLIISEKIFYTMSVGASWRDFWAGFARVGFSFFVGMAIANIHRVRPPKLKLPSGVFMLLLPVAVSLPLSTAVSHRYELACVFFLFPAMVYWGAESYERRPLLGTVLGDASYALYVVHYPLVLTAAQMLVVFSIGHSLFIEIAFVIIMIPAAWALSVADMRIRAALMARVGKRGIWQSPLVPFQSAAGRLWLRFLSR